MFIKTTLFLLINVLVFATAFSQTGFIITGKIYDSVNHQSLAGATVKVKGSNAATVAKDDGSFGLKVTQPLPVTLVVTSVGFKTQEFSVSSNSGTIAIGLNAENFFAGQVVVSASRIPESILKSPVSIEKLGLQAIKESPAPSFFDAIENLKGVQMTTLSLGFKVPNTRGFAGTTNSRFLQMVDGVDNISPGIGAPIANTVGPTELDIESIELIPGAASAVYGLNAISGISNLKTKDPFKYQGISVYQKTAVNHVDGTLHDPALYTETAIRFAKVFTPKLAFKINASYTRGTDWIADDHTDQYNSPTGTNGSQGLVGAANPAQDLINKYGDESSDRRTITLGGKRYEVARTGYFEKDLTDYAVKNAKLDAALHYKLNSSTTIAYAYRIGTASNVYQRGNRIRLDGLQIQQHSLEIRNRDFYAKAYYTNENTGDSYNMRPLGENMGLAFKKPTQWYNDFTTGYNRAIGQQATIPAALAAARSYADSGRYQPGTKAFNDVKNKIATTNNWDTVGAALILKSSFVHAEGQYNWERLIPQVQILTGFNYRNYFITPDGNSFINPASINDPKQADKSFTYSSYGGFVQATKTIFNDKLKAIASLRIDKAEYFNPKFNPRVALVYSPTNSHNLRVSYQNGFRFPTLFEGFSYVNNGGSRRLGGLPIISQSLGVFENSYTQASITAFTAAVNKSINSGATQTAAITTNKNLLVKTQYTYIQPEHIKSFEAGYKGVLLHNKLLLDIDFYYNIYDNFIGQLDVAKPAKGTIGVDNDTTATYAYTARTTKYRMWTNSTSVVSNRGITVGVNYNFYKKFNAGFNTSFAQLLDTTGTDAFTPAFNTPKWIANVFFGNSEIVKNTGFNVNLHYQNTFYWNSPLAVGTVPSYTTVDAQVNHRFPALFTTLKLGATNVFNKRYIQYIGGPIIGGFYYTSLTFDLDRSKAKSKS